MQAQVAEMLKATPLDEEAEEYAIHDYEGFGACKVSEYEELDSVHGLLVSWKSMARLQAMY